MPICVQNLLLAQFAKEAQDAKKAIEVEPEQIKPEIVSETVVEVAVKTSEPSIDQTVTKSQIKSSSNVFKTIKTEIRKRQEAETSTSCRQERRRRQPQSKKLDRRKYLEYKYAARELLENDSVSEEHRSNILGQIWAKGERSGVDDAIEFIDQKEAELIIPEEVAEEFRKMVKRYTTKR